MNKTEEIKPGEDYKIRTQTPEEKERLNPEESDIPAYRIQLNLSKDEIERLEKQVFLEFEALQKEREDAGLEKKWKERDSQYDGDLEPNKTLPFNLHVHQSKIKTDAIARGIKEAFLDADKVVDVSPRPDSSRKDGYKVAENQADFLDYAMDEEVKPDAAFDKIIKCSIKKFVGIGKLSWAYRVEKRKREETYEGKNVPVEMVGNRLLMKNEGLEQFLSAYPDGMEKYKGYVKQLMEEKKIDIVVKYKDTVDNNAKLKYVKVEDFYVRNGCDYNEGLRTEHCVVERENYTYWELKKKQDNEEFSNIEALFNQTNEDGNASDNYKTENYDVLEVTTYFKMDNSNEEVKIKAWFGEEKKSFLGAILYPYYAFDIDYIGFWVELNDYGFYGDARSVMSTMKDSNIAQNVLLNLALYGLYIRNTITPIIKEGSEAEAMIANDAIQPGKPIIVDDLTDDVNKAMGFVQWPNIDMATTMALMEMLRRDDSDTTKVSDLTSGRESVVDPTAPASKTLALLQQSGLGVKEYIRTFLPSFNIFCTMLLQIYYQMSQEGRKYQVRRKSEGVTGTDPFAFISRDEMIVKTNVQARASSFVFDKVNEKREASVAYQYISTNPYAMQQPDIQYEAFKNLIETFGGKWKNLVDKMPSPEAFKKQQMQVAMQAMAMLLKNAKEQKDNTGVMPPAPTPEQMGDAVTKSQAEAYNPALAQLEGSNK